MTRDICVFRQTFMSGYGEITVELRDKDISQIKIILQELAESGIIEPAKIL